MKSAWALMLIALVASVACNETEPKTEAKAEKAEVEAPKPEPKPKVRTPNVCKTVKVTKRLLRATGAKQRFRISVRAAGKQITARRQGEVFLRAHAAIGGEIDHGPVARPCLCNLFVARVCEIIGGARLCGLPTAISFCNSR